MVALVAAGSSARDQGAQTSAASMTSENRIIGQSSYLVTVRGSLWLYSLGRLRGKRKLLWTIDAAFGIGLPFAAFNSGLTRPGPSSDVSRLRRFQAVGGLIMR